MLKLYKYFTKRDWLSVLIIIGVTVLQVWATMTLIDYVKDIVASIMYCDYKANPSKLGNTFPTVLASLGGWEGVGQMSLAQLTALGLSQSQAEIFLKVAKASSGDIWYNGGMMILFAALVMLAQAFISVLASGIGANISRSLRTQINQKISYMSIQDINRFSSSSLITRTTNDIQQFQFFTVLSLRMFFSAPITAIWAICKIQAVSGELTLVSAAGIVVLIIGLIILVTVVMPKFKITQSLLDRVNGLTSENLNGIRVVRAYNAETYQEEKFDKANTKLTDTQLFTGRLLALVSPLIDIIMNGITLGIYWVGSVLINRGTIDYATVTSFMMLSTQIIMSFMMLMLMFIMLPRASVSAKRILEVLNTKEKVLDPEKEDRLIDQGTLEFKDVAFRYPGADKNVIEHISFKAEKGQTIAFIGSTGSGKSTLVNLVTRFYDATEGAVLIDGVNVKNVKQKTLRSLIGFVPQKGVLFSGTVKSNIAFGKEDISEEKIEKAAQVACADEFIEKMDGKYEAHIGQGGNNVSGGQRQRLCIARAVAFDPEFLVFDDSFSALDYKTDRKVRTNLAKEAKPATKLIVAQRIGTIMDADKIVVLSQGEMVGYGTHKELLQNCQIYWEIALSQLSKEELGL